MKANIFSLFGKGEDVEVMEGNAHTKPQKVKNSMLKKLYPVVLKASLLTALVSASPKEASAQNPNFRWAPESHVLFEETLRDKDKILEEFKALDVDDISSGFKKDVLDKMTPFIEKATGGTDKTAGNIAAFRALDWLYETSHYDSYNPDFLEAKSKEAFAFKPDTTYYGYGLHYNNDSKVVGKYSKAYDQTVAQHEAEKNQSYVDFVSVLYTSKDARFKMFENMSSENLQKAAQIERDVYHKWMKDEFAVDTLGVVQYDSGPSYTQHYKEGSYVGINKDFDKVVDGETHFGAIKHEITHIAQRNPYNAIFMYKYKDSFNTKGEEYRLDPYDEFEPTIAQLINCDEVYKKTMGIDINEEVEYPYSFKFGDKELNPGKLANFMREKKENAGAGATYFSLTLDPEVKAFMSEYGESFHNSVVASKQAEKDAKSTVMAAMQVRGTSR